MIPQASKIPFSFDTPCSTLQVVDGIAPQQEKQMNRVLDFDGDHDQPTEIIDCLTVVAID